MGLDTTHNAWHGPYSLFHKWRKWLAEQRGFNLPDMVGFGGTTEWTEEQKADPLFPLLYHSDCDGELSPDECKRVSKGLTMLILSTTPTKENEHHLTRCVEFRDGCNLAYSRNESIEFH